MLRAKDNNNNGTHAMRAAAYARYRSLPAGTYEHVSPARAFPARPTVVTFSAPLFLGWPPAHRVRYQIDNLLYDAKQQRISPADGPHRENPAS